MSPLLRHDLTYVIILILVGADMLFYAYRMMRRAQSVASDQVQGVMSVVRLSRFIGSVSLLAAAGIVMMNYVL